MVVTQGKTSVKCGNLNQLLLHFTEASNVANASNILFSSQTSFPLSFN